MSSVVVVAILTWICLLEQPPIEVQVPSPSWDSAAIAFGILAFQFDIHPMLLTIQMDMRDKKNLGYAVAIAFSVIGVLSLTTVSLSYELLGTAARFNVLQGLGPSPALYAALTLVTLQVSLSTVIGSNALFQQVEHKMSIPPEFSWKRCVVRGSLVGGAVLLGESVPRLDVVMSLVGGVATSQLMFVWPVVFYWKLRRRTAKKITTAPVTTYGAIESLIFRDPAFLGDVDHHQAKTAVANRSNMLHITAVINMIGQSGEISYILKGVFFSLILVGLVAAILSTIYSIKEAILYSDFTAPCIANFTIYFM